MNIVKEKNRHRENGGSFLVYLSFCLTSGVELGLTSCEVEFAIAEMACVSRNVRRTFHVPSGVPVQRSISERDVSHPVVELEKAETTSTSTNIRTTASSPLRYSGPVIQS